MNYFAVNFDAFESRGYEGRYKMKHGYGMVISEYYEGSEWGSREHMLSSSI